MPKIVDHTKQREKIIAATWQVILREGIGQTSVRKVAEEAGLSPGAMRHYFASQSELLAFTLEFIGDRLRQRLLSITYQGEPLEHIHRLIEEFLPLDEEKMQETEIWLAFIAQTTPDPRRKELNTQIYTDLKSLFVSIIGWLVQLNLTHPDIQQEIEVDRFYALVDGLAVHRFLQPDQLSTEMMRAIVQRHLASLICKT